jgi:hypothetical protein
MHTSAGQIFLGNQISENSQQVKNLDYHENNISNLGITGCMDHLLHNFSRSKIAFESHCSSSTESTAHLAPYLCYIGEAKQT